ncbi:MAG: thymidine phosphorylase [bacterium]
MRMLDLLAKKRCGAEHTAAELEFISAGAARGRIPDYQLSAWLMAAFCMGLSDRETVALTRAMAFSGKRLDFSSVKLPKADKHSTGGVGDGISLALAPLAASCGIAVPMMSGRGLGHTGGTLDKLESMKGFRVRLSPPHVLRQLKAIGVCMFGQTSELAPADRKLYSLRDATATVECLPLIVASILSKKYAEGLDALVLDVKYGTGAFLIDFDKSRRLASALTATAGRLGMKCAALITAMDQPLGRAVGNAMEMSQAIKVLHGDNSAEDFVELLGVLGGWMLFMAGKAGSPDDGMEKLDSAVRSGAALAKMRQMIKWQGGDPRVADHPDRYLPMARLVSLVKAEKAGFVSRLDARITGKASVLLGAGREKMDDVIDHGAGIMLEKKLGDRVKQGDILARLYASDSRKLAAGERLFHEAVTVAGRKPVLQPLVREIIGGS